EVFHLEHIEQQHHNIEEEFVEDLEERKIFRYVTRTIIQAKKHATIGTDPLREVFHLEHIEQQHHNIEEEFVEDLEERSLRRFMHRLNARRVTFGRQELNKKKIISRKNRIIGRILFENTFGYKGGEEQDKKRMLQTKKPIIQQCFITERISRI
ncbi:MAG: hypothetical protein EZS28_010357, partial [Streblomastix strix]